MLCMCIRNVYLLKCTQIKCYAKVLENININYLYRYAIIIHLLYRIKNICKNQLATAQKLKFRFEQLPSTQIGLLDLICKSYNIQ